MKKSIIGALVGGIIIFMVQFLSWTVLDLHYKSQQYTPKQDSILAYLASQNLKTGQYFMPALPKGSSMDAQNKLTSANMGKPWAVIAYHEKLNTNMGIGMARAFATDFVVVLLLTWVLGGGQRGFGSIFFGSLFTGAIVYLNSSYTYHIWYQTPGQLAYIIEYALEWGITGLWLGWYLSKK